MVEKNVKERQMVGDSPEKGQVLLVPYKNESKKYIVCEVCGHANPEYTALCEMCSNYLTRD